jgi:ATP-dependent DNA helicase RecG
MSENQNIEYKQIWKDEYLKWICGFANAQGGKIFIGIDDKGNITGITDHKKLLEEIPNKTVNHLALVVDVDLHIKRKKQYIEISIKPSDVPISYHGNYYYRSGSTKQELKGTALQQFLFKKMGKSWDDIPVKNATIYDLNSNTLNQFLNDATGCKRLSADAPKEDHEGLFTNLHLMNEERKLKNAALLLFGVDPLKYFPHAYFKIGRFGSSDADLKFQDVIEGNILDMPDKVMQVLRSKYLTSPIRYEGLHRKEELEYPEEALREAILNAIVHKDYTATTIQLSVYDDKLILWNPGTLPQELSIDQLKKKHASYPRNKNIADIFFKAGYIEAWGRGTNKIVEVCKAAGLPEPEFVEHAGGFQTIFLKDIYTEQYLSKLGINDRQIKAILYIKEKGFITNAILQSINSAGKSTTTLDLQDLVNREIIVQEGKAGRGVKYRLKK